MTGLGHTDSRGFKFEIDSWGDFVTTGLKLFDSEDVTDSLLRIYLSLASNGWAGSHPDIPMELGDFANIYKDGLWLPCVERIALAGQLDSRNDGLLDFAAIPIQADSVYKYNFAVAKRLPKLPRGWAALPGSSATYSLGFLYRGFGGRELRRTLSEDVLYYDGWYYSLIGDKFFPCRKSYFPNGGPAGRVSIYGSAALQTVSDFRHMWIVSTEETTLSRTTTPLRLGVDSEIIKSLFYARQAPVSESGRKRPILHWVRSHIRRLKEGIDIDVNRHMRGITEFDMGGFSFRITQPIKQKAAA